MKGLHGLLEQYFQELYEQGVRTTKQQYQLCMSVYTIPGCTCIYRCIKWIYHLSTVVILEVLLYLMYRTPFWICPILSTETRHEWKHKKTILLRKNDGKEDEKTTLCLLPETVTCYSCRAVLLSFFSIVFHSFPYFSIIFHSFPSFSIVFHHFP